MVKIMNKKEILELRKTFRPENCNISRIATCYVTSEKEKILEKSQAFLSLPEEEAFKYFDILKQALSGTVGKNLYTLKTNSIHPADESPQKLETLRKYHMNDEGMLTDLFDSIFIISGIYRPGLPIFIMHYTLQKKPKIHRMIF